jgi:hypothetical protein
MTKKRHKNLELPLFGKAKAAPARRRARPARSTSRRRLVLFDYSTWLTLTAGVAPAAANADQPAQTSRTADE